MFFSPHIFRNSGIRLLALDLDGTVLTSDKKLTDRTRNALLSAAKEGMEIVLVTGRPLFGLPEELTAMEQIHYAITSNGAVSSELPSAHKLRTALIPKEEALLILDLPISRGLLYNVFIDGIGYSSPEVYDTLITRFTGTPLEDYVRVSRRKTENIADFIRSSEEDVENIWIQAENISRRNEIHNRIAQLGNYQTVLTADTDVEIGVPAADKGLALTELAKTLGISREQILAIGDNLNDLGMLRAAGFPVAMGNASAAVKQCARFTTDTNDNDGVAKIIESLVARSLAG